MRVTLVALAIVAGLLALTDSVEAARLPAGSYRETCSNIAYADNVLTADCKARDGQWFESSLVHPDFCRTGVSNENAQLRCAGQHPAGSYTHTCQGTKSDADVLISQCQKADGSWNRATRLDDPWTCNGYIANKNGVLVCTLQ